MILPKNNMRFADLKWKERVKAAIWLSTEAEERQRKTDLSKLCLFCIHFLLCM